MLLLDVSTADIAFRQAQGMMRLIGVSLALAILSVILLSSAGIYSLMSFTVARRRRESGIRAALGANRNRILVGVFSRVLAHLGAGTVLGVIAAVGLKQILEGDMVRHYRAKPCATSNAVPHEGGPVSVTVKWETSGATHSYSRANSRNSSTPVRPTRGSSCGPRALMRFWQASPVSPRGPSTHGPLNQCRNPQ